MNDLDSKNQNRELDGILDGEASEDRERLADVWSAARGGETEPFPDPVRMDGIWQTIDSDISAPGAYPASRPRRALRKVVRRLSLGAAAIVIAVAIGLGLFTRTRSWEAPRTDRLAIDLPDGSQVELNNGSTLSFNRSLSGSRVARLEGEAYFIVEHTGRPFTLTTFNGRVEVVGTAFNVKAWPNGIDLSTRIAVEEGRVRLSHVDHPSGSVLVSAGEVRSVLGGRARPTAVDEGRRGTDTAWRDGDLVFHDERLSVALEDLERLFDVEIELPDSDLADRRISVSFRTPASADSVLEDLSQALGFSYRSIESGFSVYRDGD